MHVILGAGAVGTAVATQLAARGEQVRVLSRRGAGPEHPAVERVAADATDTARLNALTADATVLYNCANPEYHRWLTDWPPIAAALLTAAERSGAVLATTGNLYGYGPVTGPITPETPLAATHPKLHLRAQMWRDALALHEAGRIRATEVRGSDYLEANSIFTYLAGPVRAGKRVQSPVPVDVPHSWTSITDVARTLIAAAGDERGWGRAWLVPSNPPMTVRDLTNRFATVVGAPEPTVSALPYPVLWTMGVFNTMARELRTTLYQFEKPFVLDASLTERTFGITPSDLDGALRVA
ncbi:NAD-dependent epimerase/dehydratase family protein [Longispora urticae]